MLMKSSISLAKSKKEIMLSSTFQNQHFRNHKGALFLTGKQVAGEMDQRATQTHHTFSVVLFSSPTIPENRTNNKIINKNYNNIGNKNKINNTNINNNYN